MAATCPSNSRACRRSTASEILTATRALAFAATSQAWRGSNCCADTESPFRRPTPRRPCPVIWNPVQPAVPETSEIVTEPEVATTPQPATDRPDWLAPPEPPARGLARRDKVLLDLLPAGVLIYRLDRLLYANPALLKRIGYDSLHALEE